MRSRRVRNDFVIRTARFVPELDAAAARLGTASGIAIRCRFVSIPKSAGPGISRSRTCCHGLDRSAELERAGASLAPSLDVNESLLLLVAALPQAARSDA